MKRNSEIELEKSLIEDILKGDTFNFDNKLKRGVDPTKEICYKNEKVSAFEKALSTERRAPFVLLCLSWGCNPCYINQTTGKAPLHFAVESKQPSHLKELLAFPAIDINRKYEGGETALNYLIQSFGRINMQGPAPTKKTPDECINDTKECIKLLLRYGASPNITDENGIPTFLQLLNSNCAHELEPKFEKLFKKTKKELIILFLKNNKFELESEYVEHARGKIKKEFPEIACPVIEPSSKQAKTYIKLRDILHRYNTKSSQSATLKELRKYFLQQMKPEEEHIAEINTQMLNKSICFKHKEVFNALQQIKFNINNLIDLQEIKSEEEMLSLSPVIIAMRAQNLHAIKQLVRYDDLELKIMTESLYNAEPIPLECLNDFEQSCELLLAHKNFDIYSFDARGNSILHYADRNDASRVPIELLLKKGAYIATRNRITEGKRNQETGSSVAQKYTLQNTPSEILEKHFDTCITTNDKNSGDRDYKIFVDFKNLSYPNAFNDQKNMQFNQRLQQEIDAITFIAESLKYHRLLQHPLLRCFIFLKWYRISILFYINFWLYFLYSVSISLHTFFAFEDNNFWHKIFEVFSWFGLSWLIVRESFQLMQMFWTLRPLKALKCYLCSFENIIELLLIGFSMYYLLIQSNRVESISYMKKAQAAVITIALVSVELSLLAASLPMPFIPTLMFMWKTVLVTFTKCLAVFLMFLLNFTLCFHILLGKESNSSDENVALSNANNVSEYLLSSPSNTDDFTKFSNPFAAFLKTLVMLTGEFDASDMKLNCLMSKLVFLLFVFLMTIVLLNLLNGLAVSDTQALKAEAELTGLKNRVKLLQRYVKIVNSPLFANEYFQKMLQTVFVCFNKDYGICTEIAILLNQGNKIEVITVNSEFKDDQQTNIQIELKNLKGRGSATITKKTLYSNFLDSETIKLASAVIERNVAKRSQDAMKGQQKTIEILIKNILERFESLEQCKKEASNN